MLEFFFTPIGILLLGILIIFIFVAILASLYTIVPADCADVVVQQRKKRVYSTHAEYNKDEKSAYFKIPGWFFIAGLGMKVHRMPLKILSIPIPDFLAFDKDRARFLCDIVAYAVIKDPVTAAMRFPESIEILGEDISKVVRATTRDSTTKRTVKEIINDREGIVTQINKPLTDAISNWGLDLRDIELVEFKDPTETEYGEEEPSHVIKDISSVAEVKINSDARQKNAEQVKEARVKEALTDEAAQKREIQRDEEVAKRKQTKDQLVAAKEKVALAEQLEVKKVEEVKTQEIEKERALVEAKQEKEVELINKEQKKLLGEGDRLMKEEQAKGDAASVREVGKAEGEAIEAKLIGESKGKDELQKVYDRFTPDAVRAYVAKEIVDKDRSIGVAGANALKEADLKVFAGGGSGEQGFEIGKLVESIGVASKGTQASALNKIARPNDLGFKDLNLEEILGIVSQNKELQTQLKKALLEKPIAETKTTKTHNKKEVKKELP